MPKEIARQPSSEEETRQLMGELMRLPLVKQQLTEAGTWLVQPRFARSLDIGFVPRQSAGEELLGVHMFGHHNCIGLKIVNPGRHEHTYNSLHDRKVADYISQGAEIALLTVEELASWYNFYRQLDQEGILDRVGHKAHDFSGLERTRPAHHQRLEDSLAELLGRKAGELADQGVAGSEQFAGLDLAFLAEDGETMPLPRLHHIRMGQLEGEVLVETVFDGARSVPGFVIRQPWESKREAYERANYLREYFQEKLPEFAIAVPMISDGQLSLWSKLGLTGRLEASAPEARISAEDVVRFLYLGQSNIYPGELARLGYSLPGGGGEYGKIDVLFTRKNRQGSRQDTIINDLMGEDLRRLKRGKEGGLVPVANVAGLLIMPDDWSVEQMKAYAHSQQFYLNYHHYGPKVHLLYLTPRLFNTWKRRESVFASEAELESFLGRDRANGDNGQSEKETTPDQRVYPPLSRLLEYGYGAGNEPDMYLDIWRPQAEIGGMKMILSEEGPSAVAYHVLDWGTSFNVIPEDMQTIGSIPGTADGLRTQLETGQLPMVPGLYYQDYLLATAKYFPALQFDTQRPVPSFLRAEITKRVAFEEAVEYLGMAEASRIYELGKKDVDRWYQGKDKAVAEVMSTHAHVDHCGDIPYVDGPIYGRSETIAHLQAMSARARVWRNQYDSWNRLTLPKEGSAYVREYRDMWSIHWGHQRVRSSVNVSFEQHLVDHSMTGTAMTGLYRSDGSGAVLYTADVKLGPLTANTVETLAGKFDRIIMESTNFEGNKVSAGITEAKVRDSFIRIMREQANDTVVIVSAPNQLERLSSILEAAEATGRKVALGHSHALVVNQMRIGRQQAPLDVEGFNLTLPEIGEDVALWVKPQVNPQTYQKVLSEWAAAKSLGLVDQARLSAEGSKWVVVVTPYDIMRHQFGGVHFPGLSVIHSAPFPYARNAKVKLGDSQRWIRSQGGHYFTDFEIQGVGGRVIPSRNPYFLHVSGHATFEQMIDSVISPLLNGIYRNKQLILVHGENPVRYAEAMGRRLGNPAGLEIVSSLDRYRPSDPFKYSGYRLVLE